MQEAILFGDTFPLLQQVLSFKKDKGSLKRSWSEKVRRKEESSENGKIGKSKRAWRAHKPKCHFVFPPCFTVLLQYVVTSHTPNSSL